MTGEGVSVGHVRTHLHQLQLATWQVMTQGCVIFGGLNIFPTDLTSTYTMILKIPKLVDPKRHSILPKISSSRGSLSLSLSIWSKVLEAFLNIG